jgi:hypothetical protein
MLALIFVAIALFLALENKDQAPSNPEQAMQQDRITPERIRRFKQLDTEFRRLEMESDVTKVSQLSRALAVSQMIKEEFPEYDWGFHTTILNRIAEPMKR